MSIDPGRISAGAVVVEPGRLEAFRFQTRETKHAALGAFLAWIVGLVDRERPDVGLVEDYAYGIKNTSTLTQVAEVGGITRGVLASRGVPVIAVPIFTWKALTIGNHPKGTRAKDAAYVARVDAKYRMRFGSTDEADAFLIYQAMRVVWKGRLRGETNRRLRAELATAMEKLGRAEVMAGSEARIDTA